MNSQSLVELRGRIDSLDDQIIALLLERIQLSNEIMKSKAPERIVDTGREQEISRRYTERLAAASTLIKTQRLVLAVLGVSSVYPE